MCVDHLHCWSPGRMAIWGGFPVQGWNPLCDADPPRGWTFFFWVGDGQTSCEWAPDTQGDHRWGFVAACAAIPCRLFRWMVSQLVLNSTLGILKLEKQLLSDFLPVCLSCGVVRVIDEYIYIGLYLYARSECGTPKLQELTVLHRAHRACGGVWAWLCGVCHGNACWATSARVHCDVHVPPQCHASPGPA